eukprot:gnl/TRDRNA2_/TRDRNA2_64613_c0_seq1.p1 gnl/TRDRNA2_/TRDRNA2_64613_c0~~gnl/TRDRNA2_/TRDRNA2_64613_c0_seq1.p1  ORF type:complete len:182 (-),score=23.01 gnl/TRDRNA2_/TRDRNA2_64613_c0_seq1:10-489(-)
MSGPADAWYAVGFAADTMADEPYCIVVSGTAVSERKLGKYDPGVELAQSVTVVLDSEVDGQRTVTMHRPLAGMTEHHYTFGQESSDRLPIITATGSSIAFEKHETAKSAIITANVIPESNPDKSHDSSDSSPDANEAYRHGAAVVLILVHLLVSLEDYR